MRAKPGALVYLVILIACVSATLASAQVVTLPSGTILQVVMETHLNTKDSKSGDPFRSHLVMPVFVDGQEVLPVGCVVEGTVVRVQGPGRVAGKAEMQLRPEKMTLPNGDVLNVNAMITGGTAGQNTKISGKEGTVQGSGKDGMDVRGTATTATTGAVLGGVMYGGQGALIGAGAVGAIALIHQIFKKGHDAELPAGSEITLELSRPLTFNPTMKEVAPLAKDQLDQSSLPRSDRRPQLTRQPPREQ